MRTTLPNQRCPSCERRASRSAERRRPARSGPLWLGLVLSMLFLSGCGSPEPTTTDLQVDLIMAPSPPTIGLTELSLRLADAEGQPLKDAEVRVEGNMNHAGMKPSFAEMTEVEPGLYTGTIDFTMGGDWFLLVNAVTADGESFEQKVDVPGVKAP